MAVEVTLRVLSTVREDSGALQSREILYATNVRDNSTLHQSRADTTFVLAPRVESPEL